MWTPLAKHLKFYLERWIQRGVLHQLILMAALIALVALVGGLVAWLGTSQFDRPADAIWWAFLRLTDPGYLGDDEGILLRVVSTIVTVLGYVIFMGSLIAIMTQWLALTIRRLESGLTPITMQNHVVILGWTNRTSEIVAKLMGARGRLRRFLAGHRVDALRIVILTDDVGAARKLELREHLGKSWKEKQIFLRTGTSLHPEHLARLDLHRAAAIVVPGADFELGGAELTDTRIIKTLLTIQSLLATRPADEWPDIVAEVFDSFTVSVARSIMENQLEIVASNRIISRLISQSVLHRGIARILLGVLSHREGNSFFLRSFPDLAGTDPRTCPELFPRAVFLGVIRGEGPARRTLLDPRDPLSLQQEDLLIFLAERYDDCEPARGRQPAASAVRSRPAPRPSVREQEHRLLILGWSHRISALVQEMEESHSSSFDVAIMSRVPRAEREIVMNRVDFSPDRVRILHVEGDYSVEKDLVAVSPESFDHVLFLASGGMRSSEEADARTVLGHVLLRSLLKEEPDPPDLIIELLDPDNSHLFAGSGDSVLVSPRLLSHLLAHVALRPELNALFDALFCAGGTEFNLRPAQDFDLEGRDVRFADIQQKVFEFGELAVGLMSTSGAAPGLHLNPVRDRRWTLGRTDRLVVLAAQDE